ncbi:hypothetical protein RCO48_19595 [Peribacillus frigoritolerans]|nr:hypothetical protein [Peribacillus frigoritolerans]
MIQLTLKLPDRRSLVFEPFNRNNEEYAVSAGIFFGRLYRRSSQITDDYSTKKKKNTPHHEELNLNLQVNALVAYNAEKLLQDHGRP